MAVAENALEPDPPRFLESASLPMLVVDPIGDDVLWANAAAARFLGLDSAALVGHRFSRLHPGQVPVLIVFSQAVLDLGRYWTRDLSPRHAAERELRVEYRGDRLDAGDGRRLILLTLIDLDEQERHGTDAAANRFWTSGLTEWQRAERLFREIERENQLILKAAGEGIYGVNAE
ncbi:MAG: PAS domain-containing protein, partial [Gammaproteobacteria bacterium]|nr:PAS domain-containing protein [Gammaproteobacteria bacterium]